MGQFFQSLYTHTRLYQALSLVALFFVLGYFWHLVFILALVAAAVLFGVMVIDLMLLFSGRKEMLLLEAARSMPQRFSNGDDNEVTIEVTSHYRTGVWLNVIDELPAQFQIRDFSHKAYLQSQQMYRFSYVLQPTERGEYYFGLLNIYVRGGLGLFSRRFRFPEATMVKVYPSFVQMRKFKIMAISDRLSEMGIKKIRSYGHQMEFDQIREYIQGDDVRSVNWKATARKGQLMVNQYQDEKSQQVFSIVDMGRTMKMPFNGFTLLDYAINTSLVLSNIAILKHDKAGLITFNEKIRCLLPARQEPHHLQTIMEMLYNQHTGFLEHNLEALYAAVKHKIPHRSLLVLFTNFESLKSAQQEMPMLRRLASSHLLMVVFFENAEMSSLMRSEARDLEDIYRQTIAEKFVFDKKRIVKELERNGIHAILTSPGMLTVATMNRYLEFKAKGLI